MTTYEPTSRSASTTRRGSVIITPKNARQELQSLSERLPMWTDAELEAAVRKAKLLGFYAMVFPAHDMNSEHRGLTFCLARAPVVRRALLDQGQLSHYQLCYFDILREWGRRQLGLRSGGAGARADTVDDGNVNNNSNIINNNTTTAIDKGSLESFVRASRRMFENWGEHAGATCPKPRTKPQRWSMSFFPA